MKLVPTRILTVLTSLLLCTAVPAQEKASAKDDMHVRMLRSLHGDLTEVKNVYAVVTFLSGTAEQVVMSKSELEDFIKLRFRNSFAGIELRDLPRLESGLPDLEKIRPQEWAMLQVTVWTVGNDAPVAYHVELEITKFLGGSRGYKDSILGYASARAIKNDRIVKNGISDMMEHAATTLLKIQGKL